MRKHATRWLLRPLGLGLLGLLCLVASVAAHLDSDLAKAVAIDLVGKALNREIRGELRIGGVHNLTLGKVVVLDVRFYDPSGRLVIRAERLAATPDFRRLLDGVLRVDRVRLRGGEVWLHEAMDPSAGVSIAETFFPARPPDPDEPPGEPPNIHVEVDDIVIDDVRVRGEVPGLSGIRVDGVRVAGWVDVLGDQVRVRVEEGSGDITGPLQGRVRLTQVQALVDSGSDEVLAVAARAQRGEDRATASLLLRQGQDGGPPHLTIEAGVDPLRPETLAALGLEGLDEALAGTYRAEARLEGPPEDLALSGTVRAEAGTVRVTGRLPAGEPIAIHAATDELRVHELVPSSPRLVASGEATLTLTPDPEGGPIERRVTGRIRGADLLGVVLPSFDVDLELEDDRLVVDEVSTAHLGGDLRGHGVIGFNGSLDLEVEGSLPDVGADPNVRRAVPGAHGALSVDVDIDAGPELADLTFDGVLTLRDLRYGPVRASRVRVAGRGVGELPAPELRLRADAEELVLADVRLGTATAEVRGGEAGYDVDVTTDDGAGASFALDGRAVARDGEVELSSATLSLDPGDGRWTGSARRVALSGEALSVGDLSMAHEGERVAVSGIARFGQDDELSLDVEGFELRHLRPLLPDFPRIGGRLTLRGRLSGDIDRRPEVTLAGELEDGSIRALTNVQGEIDVALADGVLDGEVSLDLGPGGRLRARGPLRFPPGTGITAADRLVENGTFEEAEVVVDEVRLGPVLASVGAEELQLGGRVSAEMVVVGPLLRPVPRRAHVIGHRLTLEGWDPLWIKARAYYEDETITLERIWVADQSGELLSGNGTAPLDLNAPPEDLLSLYRSLARSAGWDVSVRLTPRRLESWPRPLGSFLPVGLTGSAVLHLRGTDDGPVAYLEAQGGWVEPATMDRCAEGLRPRFRATGVFSADHAVVEAHGSTGPGAPSVVVDGAATIDVERWIRRGRVEGIPSSEVRARFSGLDIGELPWTCAYGEGAVWGDAEVADLLTGQSRITARVDLPALRLHAPRPTEDGDLVEDETFRVHLRVSPGEDGMVDGCAILGRADASATPADRCQDLGTEARPSELLATARVPVRWTVGQVLPDLPADAPITARASLAEVDLAPVLRFIPGVVTGTALVSGDAELDGPASDLGLRGELTLAQGRLQVEGLGQHLDQIEGSVLLSRGEIRLPEDDPVVFRDGGGRTQVSGRIAMRGLVPQGVDIQASASAFPVRNEGIVLAWLSADADLSGTIGTAGTESRIRIRGATVRLPDEGAAGLQALGPNPDILVVGERRPPSEAERSASYRVDIAVDATEPFWVRRSDFAVQVWAELNAVYQDPDLRIAGTAHINRGTFEIFGKRFELLPGGLSFDGSTSLDPTVNITALYELPGRQGATVTVLVSGRLSAPEVAFSSTETSDKGEIIALLLSGGQRASGTAEQEVTEQAASFLTGLTAGILTLGLRQEFGDVIPVLAIESTGAQTRVRAGFNADDLIPDFLRDVVTGAYIEGFLTTVADNRNAAGSSAGQGGVGGGVTIEFNFPRSILLRGTYVPDDTGSIDVLFQP
ncbi:MAG: translocation/assembly module TamB domain-containing protein [Sandaracinaceae bacterium]